MLPDPVRVLRRRAGSAGSLVAATVPMMTFLMFALPLLALMFLFRAK